MFSQLQSSPFCFEASKRAQTGHGAGGGDGWSAGGTGDDAYVAGGDGWIAGGTCGYG